MSDLVIEVENLCKRYRLGLIGSGTLRADLSRAWARIRGRTVPATAERLHHGDRQSGLDFQALDDVSFGVKKGEVVGILGANGAGKSTLLKILCRITAPTSGEVRVKGRIASLLEVGTGFHPDLTGRENIFLNGAILGMSKSEIRGKLDDIISFSGLEPFIDTPVKRYSSGMYVRLAFAVAAHLDPDILVLDEVLAVGDMNFQKKCIGKMGEVARGGRTVLFVSHNMAALLNMCTRGLLMMEGRVAVDGPIADVVRQYIGEIRAGSGEVRWPDRATAPGNEIVLLRAVRTISEGIATSEIGFEQAIDIQIEFENLKPGMTFLISVHVLDSLGNAVLASTNLPSANTKVDPWYGRAYHVGRFRANCTIPGGLLNTGSYTLNAIVLTGNGVVQVLERQVLSLTIHETGAMRKEYSGDWIGVVRPKLAWATESLDA